MFNTYQSSGDLGDIVASLAAVKHLGAGPYHLVDRPWTKAITPRVRLIESLLQSQPYISDVVVGDPHGGLRLRDFSTFRDGGLPWGTTLGVLQAQWVGADPSLIDWHAPWLDLPAAPGYKDKVVIARSPRYHNHTFPWRQVANFYRGHAVFLGLTEEHEVFQTMFGASLPRVECKDLLEVGTIIKGAALFIGNQSSPFNIAEAMKVPRILEVCTWTPDCCYGGGEVQYCPDGAASFPRPDGEVLHTGQWMPPRELDISITPPGGWRFTLPGGQEVRGISYWQTVTLVSQALRGAAVLTTDDIGAELQRQTIERMPDTGFPRWFVEQQEINKRIRNLCCNASV